MCWIKKDLILCIKVVEHPYRVLVLTCTRTRSVSITHYELYCLLATFVMMFQAQDFIDQFEYELAQKFCQRALEMEADNVRALETSGALLTDLGNIEGAKQVYKGRREISRGRLETSGVLFICLVFVECNIYKTSTA